MIDSNLPPSALAKQTAVVGEMRSELDRLTDSPQRLRRELELLAEGIGQPVFVVDVATAGVVLKSDANTLPFVPSVIQKRLAEIDEPRVFVLPSGLQVGVIPVDGFLEPAAAITFTLRTRQQIPEELNLAAMTAGWDASRLSQFVTDMPSGSPVLFERVISLAHERVLRFRDVDEREEEIESLGDEIEKTYEELNLLHSLTRNLHLSRSPFDLAQVCVERLRDRLHCGGNAIWIETADEQTRFITQGGLPFDEFGLAQLVSRFESHDWSRPLVRNRIEDTLLGTDFPGLRDFVIVPISQKEHRRGWIVSVNAPDGHEFGTVEGSLMNSVATILGTHLRNIELYREHEELLISFVKSMVSTLDAKDRYTRGHSGRVALVAKCLAEGLGLPEVEQNSIYLSGLLHDVGKIGVDDQILRKPGRLTDEEFEQIKLHPAIGYEILKGMKNLQHVIPGVRSHHESWDGSGYPDGLRGSEIPLMARILAVADSYDAMGSDRPYRKGMPMEKIHNIFRDGSGSQWDENIIEVYFERHEEILAICQNYDPEADADLALLDQRRGEA